MRRTGQRAAGDGGDAGRSPPRASPRRAPRGWRLRARSREGLLDEGDLRWCPEGGWEAGLCVPPVSPASVLSAKRMQPGWERGAAPETSSLRATELLFIYLFWSLSPS